jgi:hypothetical protein
VGKFRGACTSTANGQCLDCTNGPYASQYTSAGNPYNANNCQWFCPTGYYNKDACNE